MRWIIGYAKGGDHGTYLDGASAKLIYPSDSAIDYLKAVLNSDRTVQVHLDLHYLNSYHLKFQGMLEGSSHFMVVTGYDEGYIYLSDTYLVDTSKDEYKDMAVPIDVFINAWEHGGDIGKGFELQTGPYWMLFFTSTANSDITKPSFTDIISLQKTLSENIEGHFDTYISKIDAGEYDTSDTPWNNLADIKQLFAEYLRDNGYDDAADAYDQLYEEYDYYHPNPNIVKDNIESAKEKEIAARNLLP